MVLVIIIIKDINLKVYNVV